MHLRRNLGMSRLAHPEYALDPQRCRHGVETVEPSRPALAGRMSSASFQFANLEDHGDMSDRKIRFGVIGLNHGHIYPMTRTLLGWGGELVSVYEIGRASCRE